MPRVEHEERPFSSCQKFQTQFICGLCGQDSCQFPFGSGYIGLRQRPGSRRAEPGIPEFQGNPPLPGVVTLPGEGEGSGMSHQPRGQGLVVENISIVDTVWEELWEGEGVGLGVSQSPERVSPQPSNQKASCTQQEPSFRSPGNSLTSAPSLPQRLGPAKDPPHGNRAVHPKKGGQHPRSKASTGGNEWDECE